MCTTYQVYLQKRDAPWPKNKWKTEKELEIPGEAARVCGCWLFSHEAEEAALPGNWMKDDHEFREKVADTQAQMLVTLMELMSNLGMNQRIVIETF
jgi:hypothetical protein